MQWPLSPCGYPCPLPGSVRSPLGGDGGDGQGVIKIGYNDLYRYAASGSTGIGKTTLARVIAKVRVNVLSLVVEENKTVDEVADIIRGRAPR